MTRARRARSAPSFRLIPLQFAKRTREDFEAELKDPLAARRPPRAA